jgi:hypothetical protein
MAFLLLRAIYTVAVVPEVSHDAGEQGKHHAGHLHGHLYRSNGQMKFFRNLAIPIQLPVRVTEYDHIGSRRGRQAFGCRKHDDHRIFYPG